MLSASAYSFRQKSRLAISLSWVAGFTNVLSLLACGSVVSHVTGTTTLLATALANWQIEKIVYFAILWCTFLAGAFTSGMMTEWGQRRGHASKYSLPMVAEAFLLICFALSVRWSHGDGTAAVLRTLATASFAMGIQNATITKISGAVVRTTHLTGVTTDLGLETVHFLFWLRDKFRLRYARPRRLLRLAQRQPGLLRVALLASIFGSFLFGAVAASWMYASWGAAGMALPVGFLLWIVLIESRGPVGQLLPVDPKSDPEMQKLGIFDDLLPEELKIWRITSHSKRPFQKPPEFLHWAQHLTADNRVIIMALNPLTQFTPNSVLDLQAALKHLHERRRRLILSGVTRPQFQTLLQGHIRKAMDPRNICPDLEFAIARGLEVLRHLVGEDYEANTAAPTPRSTTIAGE